MTLLPSGLSHGAVSQAVLDVLLVEGSQPPVSDVPRGCAVTRLRLITPRIC